MRQERNRYEVFGVIASGGMATIEYARLHRPLGFTRTVAIKRLHKHFASDAAFVEMFIDEARLSARLDHTNIVSTLDVIDQLGELGLVMEYVHGESLVRILQLANERAMRVPVRIASAIATSVLHGLHAAHEACSDDGVSLGIVHRDVSPHNIIIGVDGVPRILDFGIAKAATKLHITPSGEIKGKLAYIAPEQLSGGEVDRRTDIYGASVVMWEILTGFPVFGAENEMGVISRVLHDGVSLPSEHAPEVPPELDRIVQKGMSRDPSQRFATALEMADEIERSVAIASQSEVAKWLQSLAGPELAERLARLRKLQDPAAHAPTTVHVPLTAADDGTRRIDTDSVGPAIVTQTPSAAAAHIPSVRKRWIAAGALTAVALAASTMMIARAWWTDGQDARHSANPVPPSLTAPSSAPIVEAAPGEQRRSRAAEPSANDAAAPNVPAQAQASGMLPSAGPPTAAQRLNQSVGAAEHEPRGRRSKPSGGQAKRAKEHADASQPFIEQASTHDERSAEPARAPRPVEPAKPAAECSPFVYDGLIKRPNTKCVTR